MKTWIWTSLAAVLALGMALPGLALAGSNPDAVLALHVGNRVSKNICDVNLPTDCQSYVTDTIGSGFFNVYLTVAGYDSMGIAGLQFGIDYDDAVGSGADVSGWTSCSDMEFPMYNWPEANSGNLMTWDWSTACQVDTTGYNPVLAGVFQITAYSGDVFSLTPRPVDGRAKVADCSLAEDDLTDYEPSRLGVVAFGSSSGYNPCATSVPVRRTTWGSIKALFEN